VSIATDYGIEPPEVSTIVEKPDRKPLTLRKPSEILAMRFDDSDIILGDRLVAKGQPCVIAGAGGLGKSRLLIQLAACCATGRPFLGIPTGGEELRWLILQTENSNRRYQKELAHMKAWLGDDWPRFDELVTVHTLETDEDGFVSLASPENEARIVDAINAITPGIVAIDPLQDFGMGDLNKDADMLQTVRAMSRIYRKSNPERALVVLHHSLTGRAGATRATGFDRSSFARNSKVLYGWTRAQINLAPYSPDNNDQLVVACGKCSNGREFAPFGIRFNPETFIYEPDPSIDVAGWEREMTGKADREPLMTPDRVKELCRPLMSKADLAKTIREDCGCARQVAYKYIKRAEQRGKIQWNAKHEHYSPK